MKLYPAELKDKNTVDFVRRMAHMAEYREPDALHHRERVRAFCHILSISYGLSHEEADLISYASLLHDVGKICLPDYLSTKSADLTPLEWEQIMKHTTFGADLLKGSSLPILNAAESIAEYHHERWDGSGYPYGTRGEDIPLGARICAVADVFDALTTSRKYKSEVPLEDAIGLIVESQGTLFDPRVVEAFNKSIDEVLQARSLGILKPVFEL